MVIVWAGTLLAARGDVIADRFGWGEAVVGALLLGAATSLPDFIVSVSSAYQGYARLAASNAIGGIAVQTVFLVIADLSYRQRNLEFAATSAATLTQSALLVALLAVPLAAANSPDVTIWGVHPASIVMLAGYAYGVRLMQSAKTTPMWLPRTTRKEQQDGAPEPEGSKDKSRQRLLLEFVGLVCIIGLAGASLSESAQEIADRTGLGETTVGGLMTAVATSLSELVVSIAAVRRGALTLAVSGVIGGNAFDTLLIAAADLAYRDGSLYHSISAADLSVAAIAITMTGTLLLGLLRREEKGPAGIGFEGVIVLSLYAVAAITMASAS